MGYIQRDFLQELEDAEKVNSVEMQHYVRKMGTQYEFTATEVALVLGFRHSQSVYELAEAGEIGYMAREKGNRRSYVFPRASILKFLQERCNKR